MMKGYLNAYNDLVKENNDIYRNLSKSFGMGECSFWILYLLWEQEGAMSQSDLCRSLSLPKQTVNSALKKMAAEGWLSLCEGKDHRQKSVILSTQGLQLAKQSVDEVMMREEAAFACLSQEEREQLIALFRKYTTHLREQMNQLLTVTIKE